MTWGEEFNMDFSGVWTLAETRGSELKQVSFELLTRGRKLADKLGVPLSSVVMGNGVSRESLDDLIKRGADRIYLVQSEELEHFLVETYSNILSSLIETYRPEIVIAAATTTGRTLMPHVSMRIHAGLTADCTGLDIEEGTKILLQTRPAIGGNILATIKTPDHRPQMATVRPRSTRPAPYDPERTGEIIEIPLDRSLIDKRVTWMGFRKGDMEEVDIQAADVVVSGGKGLKKAENFKLVEELAASLKGTVGASRDTVDRGWISYPHQVGLSGKTVTPRLYVAAGISGAIQHLAGMKTADTIVAINIDPDAQIFKVCDFGIVGDLFEIIPIIKEKLQEVSEQ